MATRCAVNEIVPDLVYQRGQVFTWPREQKLQLIQAYKISWIINFWPKIDPDLADMPVLRGYLFIPLHSSSHVLNDYVARLAAFVAKEIDPDHTALILCEAGKTRSVFFSALLAMQLLKISGPEALEHVRRIIPSESLKANMTLHLKGLV